MSTEKLEMLYNYLFEKGLLNYQEIADNLRLCALGGRICYSSDTVEAILEKDDRVNKNGYLDYLKRLSTKGHTSIFSHNVIIKDLNKFLNEDNLLFTFNELLGLDDNVKYLLEFLSPTEQTFPALVDVDEHIQKSKNAYITLLKLILRYYLKGIPYTPNTEDLTINFRTILEVAKLIGKEEKLWNELSKYKSEKVILIDTKYLSTGGKIHFLRYANIGNNKVITFILEGVSRVLTHQLVRHKLDVEYSQRSHRYTKIKGNIDNPSELFVIPNLNYIENEKVRSEYLNLIEIEYINELQVYNKLIEKQKKGKKIYQVKAEDARYIIGDGIRTTIMITMYSNETIDNFIKLRADNHAQWEIREIAENIKDFINETEQLGK